MDVLMVLSISSFVVETMEKANAYSVKTYCSYVSYSKLTCKSMLSSLSTLLLSLGSCVQNGMDK